MKKNMTDWGYVVKISIYVEDKHPDGDTIIKAVKEACNCFDQDTLDFAGASVNPVKERPRSQEST